MPNYLTTDEIREKFIKFFRDKHNSREVESSSLVPDNPTILLTTAGMVQFVPYFLGLETPPEPPIAVSCQKCARAGGKDSDIENVGRTPRHHTFFEMLGNFSFGDYFKKDVIPWAWEFVTEELGLEKDRLWVTIYETDDEAYEIWANSTDVPRERILRKGKKDNFWGPPGPTGPCGPCTEIHYDLGESLKCSDDCSISTCECDRWVEIWNLVFMQLFQDENGKQTPLEKKNVDTGMGLERIAMVVQGKTSTFETDILKNLLDEVSTMAGVPYKNSAKTDISLRIITDHVRCVSFLISDGVLPGNEARSYVLRMIIRRALRHGKILGMDLNFLHKLVPSVVKAYGKTYPQLVRDEAKIIEILTKEENQFKTTLDKGQKLLDEVIKEASNSNKIINGENAFKLYDTFGFPLELTVEIASESGVTVDLDSFKEEMKKQKERAKASIQKVILTDDLVFVNLEKRLGKTNFTGYETTENKTAKVLAIVKELVETESAEQNETNLYDIILNTTPFYAESGGQVGDSGTLSGKGLNAEVLTTFKVDKLSIHRCKVLNGELKAGDEVVAQVDKERRANITRHHTLAHLLQAALIEVLGNEVKQAGSQVEENRTRFDFSFSRAMTIQELIKVEKIINKKIAEDLKQNTDVLNLAEAKRQGATALFGEKYEDTVRVVSFAKNGNCYSKELCGGCHVKSTIDLRLAKIVSESAISAGVRRIELVCGDSAFDFIDRKANVTNILSHELRCQPDELIQRVNKLVTDNKSAQIELTELKSKVANAKFDSFISKAKEIQGGKMFISKIDFDTLQNDNNILKNAIEHIAGKLGESIIVLVATKSDGSATIVSKVSEHFVKSGINAGAIIKELAEKCDGRGGGKPIFAQGNIKKLENITETLQELENKLSSL